MGLTRFGSGSVGDCHKGHHFSIEESSFPLKNFHFLLKNGLDLYIKTDGSAVAAVS